MIHWLARVVVACVCGVRMKVPRIYLSSPSSSGNDGVCNARRLFHSWSDAEKQHSRLDFSDRQCMFAIDLLIMIGLANTVFVVVLTHPL